MMLSGLILRLLSLSLVLTAALIGVICARSVDEDAVRAVLLAADDCPMPCWQGIRPGVTTRDEALRLLNAHPWVADVVDGAQHISWRWNGQQPALIDGAHHGLLRVGGGVVRQLRIQTHIPFGAVWVMLRQPDDATLVRPLSRISAYQIAQYDEGLYVISSLRCPMGPGIFWWATTTLGLGDVWLTEALNGQRYDIYDTPGWWETLHRCRRPSAQ